MNGSPDSQAGPNLIAEEAARAVERSWLQEQREAAPPSRRSRWKARIGGAVVAIALTALSMLAGGADAAEAVFGVTALGTIIGLAVGSGMRAVPANNVALAGEALMGFGAGAAAGFAWLFVVPNL